MRGDVEWILGNIWIEIDNIDGGAGKELVVGDRVDRLKRDGPATSSRWTLLEVDMSYHHDQCVGRQGSASLTSHS